MIKKLLFILILFCVSQEFHSQESGVAALALPVRNSLKFNKHIINPTFSFVREQNKYISFSNKKQWAQFDNAPQAYLFSYSGRFAENIGAGTTLFQRDYGVYTTFGGLLNFSYNATLTRNNNLTFGLNVGAYQSSLNTGKVIANLSDSSLDNVPSSFLLTINPGINYGTTFFDFGVSINNLVSYNMSNSSIIEEDPEQSLQAHVMYTGYVETRGFFHESKFSALVRSEFKKEKTVFSGLMMLTIPKGIWGQIGYNTLFGASAGLGANLSNQIALEYNYEQAIGELSGFGNSHEISIAYRFKRKQRYHYSDFDEEASLFKTNKPQRRLASRSQSKKRTPRKPKEVSKEEDTILDEDVPVVAVEEKLEETEPIVQTEETKPENIEEQPKSIVEETTEEQPSLVEEIEEEKIEEQIQPIDEKEVEEQTQLAEVVDEPVQETTEEEERIKQEDLDGVVISAPKDENENAINALTELSNAAKIKQQELLLKFKDKVDSQQKDLDDLKEENDLSEQGIYVEPKPFKSISAENAAIEALKSDIDNLIKEQTVQIQELETVYLNRLKKVSDKLDPVNVQYLTTIEQLKAEQLNTIRTKEKMVADLEVIKVATEIERKRRIKRALFDNDQDRYLKDRAALTSILNNTPLSNEPLSEEDFDFGEEQSSGIQILKNINNIESGYYLVVAVHGDVEKRDEFLRKIVSTGQQNVNFFYDVNTSKYYIYYEKHEYLNNAQDAFNAKGSKPYNANMSLIKIEN